jgi:hypothetical protein
VHVSLRVEEQLAMRWNMDRFFLHSKDSMRARPRMTARACMHACLRPSRADRALVCIMQIACPRGDERRSVRENLKPHSYGSVGHILSVQISSVIGANTFAHCREHPILFQFAISWSLLFSTDYAIAFPPHARC